MRTDDEPSAGRAWLVAVTGELVIAALIVAFAGWGVGPADRGGDEPARPTSRGSLPPSAAPRSTTTPITYQTTCWPAYQPAPADGISYNACAVQQGNKVVMRVFLTSPTKRALDVYVWLHNAAAKRKVEPRAACASMRVGRQPVWCGDFFAGPPDPGPWQVALVVKPAGTEFSQDEWLKPETTGYLSRPFRW
jgi:hypothetical protein